MAEEKKKAKKEEAKAEAKAEDKGKTEPKKPAAVAEKKPESKVSAKPEGKKAEPAMAEKAAKEQEKAPVKEASKKVLSSETKAKEEQKKEVKPFSSILGQKVGMTQIYSKDGKVVPVTVVEAGPCVVIQKKTDEADGYSALQLGFGKGKNINKPAMGHFKAANPESAPRFLREVREKESGSFNVGEKINVDVFKAGDVVKVTGESIGKGFAGTVKKWHFGRGPMTHGSKSHRIPGSIGAGTTPGRVYKGRKMPGRMGGEKVTQKNVKVVDVDADKNLLLLKGAVPGKKGSFLVIRKAI